MASSTPRPATIRRRLGRELQILLDVAAWAFGLTLAVAIRHDFRVDAAARRGLLAAIGVAAVAQVVLGVLLSLYRRRHPYGSFEEVAVLAGVVAMVTVVLTAVDVAREAHPIPLSAAVGGSAPTLVAMLGFRYSWRLAIERKLRPRAPDVSRLLVFGAGEAGQQVLTQLLRDPDSRYLPVALLDDDPRKRNLRIRRIRVAGDRSTIAEAKRRTGADTMLIAIPSADARTVRELTALAETHDLGVKVLPPVREILDGRVEVGDIRDIELVDLLGRRQVETDVDSIAHYLTGRRVLVTGAGGSIGAELCRQIHQYGPAELIMLDRDESALHAVELSLRGRALLDDASTVLLNIRDEETLSRTFAARRPEVVFHAAALKHLPLLERFPGEAVKTNVWGTLAVLEAAQESGVERFINISTDKAADPQSVLGYTKRLTERLTAYASLTAKGTYLSVRFGNVLGSRGSIIPTFQAQLAAGGPLTVTHPDVTRYFMTIQEAVQLVVQAGAIGRRGEVLVLDMGEPVRIAEVARRLAASGPEPVEVVYTGLRPGEKLHERLLGDGERDERPVHPLISHVQVPPLAPAEVRTLDPWSEHDELVGNLRLLCSGGNAQVVLGDERGLSYQRQAGGHPRES